MKQKLLLIALLGMVASACSTTGSKKVDSDDENWKVERRFFHHMGRLEDR